jgi:Xaa-Pro aminopeptidase
MYFHRGAWWWPDSDLSAASLETCAWSHLAPHVGLLDVAPIGREEYLRRQGTLAGELRAAGADAFVAEPSASSAYYANVSYEFDLSERPFLVIVDKDAQFSYLVPKFEAGRIAGLEMVYSDKTVIEWAEEESPYEVLAKATGYSKIVLDEHARFMIAAGLQKAGVEVVPMNEATQSLRSVKTEAEIEILKGINSFTLELVRSLQKCIKVGLTQETVVTSAEALFTRAGVGRGFWSIVLFGDQAAYPHGGKHGKTLEEGEYVLIDIGSKLHDYGSDVTRTVLPAGGQVSDELRGVWKTVYESQAAGFNLMHPNETCSEVDSASRKPISDAGYAEFYTHRLGHGLGLEMHEHPYLNGANSEKLRIGQVVSNEPVSLPTIVMGCPSNNTADMAQGIYVTSEQAYKVGREVGFGVRLEDPILVTMKGGVPLTGSRATSPYEP